MAKPYFLIDFENVQPKALDQLQPGTSRIKVFLGQHQNKLMLELVQALQPFGSDAEYIAIQGSGPDAVDFHIAFYIGRLAADEPTAEFNIISKDRGFDPLVRHLNGLGIACRRLADIPGASATLPVVPVPAAATRKTAKVVKKTVAKKAPAKKASASVAKSAVATPAAAKGTTTRARVAEVIALLKKSTKPAKLSSLRSAIKSWFKPALDDAAVDAVVQSLQGSKKVTVEGAKVTYQLG